MVHKPPTQVDHIPLEQCLDRRVYKLRARGLRLGVFNALNSRFIGIRCEWGIDVLGQELHWDVGEPHGTAKPMELLPDVLSSHVPLVKHLPSKEGERVLQENEELFAFLMDVEQRYLDWRG